MRIFEIEKFTDISHTTVIELYKILRRLMKEFLETNPLTLGNTEGSIVEIDERLFGKKAKYHRGTCLQVIYVYSLIYIKIL